MLVVVVMVLVAVVVRMGMARTAREHRRTDADHHQPGREVEARKITRPDSARTRRSVGANSASSVESAVRK